MLYFPTNVFFISAIVNKSHMEFRPNHMKKRDNSLDKNAHRLLSVSDSSASKTAAPINKYVKVHTTKESVLTFCRFILQDVKIVTTLSLPLGSRI